MKAFADTNVFQKLNVFWEEKKKLEKGEKAGLTAVFSFFHTVFRSKSLTRLLEVGLCSKEFTSLQKNCNTITCLEFKPFENTVGKGEFARNEQFLLFPQCFLSILGAVCHFCQI